MIGYITIGSNDLSASNAFFDALLAELGAARAYSLDTLTAWSFGPERPMLMVTAPYDANPATAGNGTMIALQARDRAHVDTIHALALSLGATDEGAPGPRGRNFYGGYFRDPDGNKFNAFVNG